MTVSQRVNAEWNAVPYPDGWTSVSDPEAVTYWHDAGVPWRARSWRGVKHPSSPALHTVSRAEWGDAPLPRTIWVPRQLTRAARVIDEDRLWSFADAIGGARGLVRRPELVSALLATAALVPAGTERRAALAALMEGA